MYRDMVLVEVMIHKVTKARSEFFLQRRPEKIIATASVRSFRQSCGRNRLLEQGLHGSRDIAIGGHREKHSG